MKASTKERLRKLREKFHLGEYRLKKPSKPKIVKRKRTRTLKVVKMVKRRHSKRSSGFGSNKLMNGFIQPKGIIQKALLGIAVSELNDSFAPQMVPYQGVILAGIVGGVPAMAGAYGVNNLQGKATSKGSLNPYGNY